MLFYLCISDVTYGFMGLLIFLVVRCVAAEGRSTLFGGRPPRCLVTGVSVKKPVLIPRVHGVFCAAICCSLPVVFKFLVLCVRV
jgi:hypothetical protein